MHRQVRTIQNELARAREHISKLEESLAEKPDYGIGKGDPAIVRWELNHALLQQSRERAASLERALSRSNQGRYGVCEQCGNSIHPDRLAVLPDVQVCIHCARARESA